MPGRLPEGIYEHLIDSLLEQQLADLSQDSFASSRQSLDKTEAPISLTRFLGQLLPTVLRAVGEGEENKTAAQVAVVNEILASLARYPKLSWLRDRRITPPRRGADRHRRQDRELAIGPIPGNHSPLDSPE